MQWILLAVAPILAFLEERPDFLARISLELQIDRNITIKRYIAAWVRYAYLGFRKLHEKVHKLPPQTNYDKLALVLWFKGSNLIDSSKVWLSEQTNQEPKYSEHKDALIHAYKSIFPQTPITGRSLGKDGIDWVSLGFQGTDPCTDFRGAGILGLNHFTGFCNNYSKKALDLAKESKSITPTDDPLWYSLALVSINLSSYLATLLQDEPLFIACITGQGSSLAEPLGHFHNHLLMGFHTYWLKEQQLGLVKSVMDTDACLGRYEQQIPGMLWQLVVKN